MSAYRGRRPAANGAQRNHTESPTHAFVGRTFSHTAPYAPFSLPSVAHAEDAAFFQSPQAGPAVLNRAKEDEAG